MSRRVVTRSGLAAIPRGVWVLGLVSLCMDLSSELVHALLPLYLATVLGTSVAVIGLIEGMAEAIALFMKLFSGVLSDWTRKRKPLVLAGYGIAALSKFVFPLAATLPWIVGARFADRVGKGIRGAPRDALIADITPPAIRGRSFGLRQALDTVGGVGGPLLALGAMAVFVGDFRMVFWIAVIPAMLAVILIVVGVDEPEPSAKAGAAKPRLRLADAGRMPPAFWFVVAIAGVLTLARFSEAFLLLRALNVGATVGTAPLVMVVMSLVYAAVSYPAGVALDRGHAPALLGWGLAALVAADVVLARADAMSTVLLGTALWGLHMGLTQGLLSALVATVAPDNLRGTAFGLFNIVSGVALLAASMLAGWLWDAHGPAVTFYAGAIFTVVAAVGLWLRRAAVAAIGRGD
ncbi:MAG: MFS transporter [Betaproteobacteria bacterium]